MKTYPTNAERKAAKAAKREEMKNSSITIRQVANYNPYNDGLEPVKEEVRLSVNEIEEMRLNSIRNQRSSSLR